MPERPEISRNSLRIYTEPFDPADNVPVTGVAKEPSAATSEMGMITGEAFILGRTTADPAAALLILQLSLVLLSR